MLTDTERPRQSDHQRARQLETLQISEGFSRQVPQRVQSWLEKQRSRVPPPQANAHRRGNRIHGRQGHLAGYSVRSNSDL